MVLVFFFLNQTTKPPALDGAARRFQAAWNEGGPGLDLVRRLGRFLDPDGEMQFRNGLAKRLGWLGWQEKRPGLNEPVVDQKGENYGKTNYPLAGFGAGDPWQVWWVYREGRWMVTDMTFPKGWRKLYRRR